MGIKSDPKLLFANTFTDFFRVTNINKGPVDGRISQLVGDFLQRCEEKDYHAASVVMMVSANVYKVLTRDNREILLSAAVPGAKIINLFTNKTFLAYLLTIASPSGSKKDDTTIKTNDKGQRIIDRLKLPVAMGFVERYSDLSAFGQLRDRPWESLFVNQLKERGWNVRRTLESYIQSAVN